MRMLSVFVLIISAGLLPGQSDAFTIIKKSQAIHDPGNLWDSMALKFHIEEPRVANPFRYSILELDNGLSTFKLQRNRKNEIVSYIVDQLGNNKALLNGNEETDPKLIEEYRLRPESSSNYARFYRFYYGLPMSLNDENILYAEFSETDSFQSEEVYKISIELHDPMISKYWNVFIPTENYRIIGLEIIFPEDPSKGERITFARALMYNGILFPRMRHWYDRMEEEYLGSDLIIH